jgi:hypothetical protein
MPVVSLDDLDNAYRRVRRSIARSMEDAADFNDNAVFDALARDQNIVDAAFFVLIFGQLENRITILAVQKVQQVAKKNALRDAKFEKRLEIALREHADLKSEIEDWYVVRSDVAHGGGIAAGYDIGAVLTKTRAIDKLLTGTA